MEQRHVISVQQFDRQDLTDIFDAAERLERVALHGDNRLAGKLMNTLFYEPSTRTRLSFETAMLRLGGRVTSTENAREYSSMAKGETLEDSIRTVACYADVIVIRHDEAGAAARAAAVSPVPVINAGDGAGEHPTQAMLDLYTIRSELKRLEGLTVAFVGDLANGRTVRSLAKVASLFAPKKFIFVAPDVVRMKDDIRQFLAERGVAFEDQEDLGAAMAEADVVYQTRIQKERFGDRLDDYQRAYGKYVIDARMMARLRKDAIVMHPLPRVGEIATEVDADPRAAYFRQVRNGLLVRMALLQRIFS